MNNPERKSISELWKMFGKYVYIGVGAIAFLVGIVWVGQWWAAGKADEFANRLHERWMATDGRAIYDNIAINRNKISELDSGYKSQSIQLERISRERRKGIDNAIKSGDTKTIASMFDNLVDGYNPNK